MSLPYRWREVITLNNDSVDSRSPRLSRPSSVGRQLDYPGRVGARTNVLSPRGRFRYYRLVHYDTSVQDFLDLPSLTSPTRGDVIGLLAKGWRLDPNLRQTISDSESCRGSREDEIVTLEPFWGRRDSQRKRLISSGRIETPFDPEDE